MERKERNRNVGLLLVIFLLLIGAGCATAPTVQQAYVQPTVFQPAPDDHTVYIKYTNNTPIAIRYLPQTINAIRSRGYMITGSEDEADIIIDLNYNLFKQHNSQKQAQNAAIGSFIGAALGVIVAAAVTGDAGDMLGGAGGGAVAGALEGASQDATSPYIDITVNVMDRAGNHGQAQNIINIENIGSYQQTQAYIDGQTAALISQILN